MKIVWGAHVKVISEDKLGPFCDTVYIESPKVVRIRSIKLAPIVVIARCMDIQNCHGLFAVLAQQCAEKNCFSVNKRAEQLASLPLPPLSLALPDLVFSVAARSAIKQRRRIVGWQIAEGVDGWCPGHRSSSSSPVWEYNPSDIIPPRFSRKPDNGVWVVFLCLRHW